MPEHYGFRLRLTCDGEVVGERETVATTAAADAVFRGVLGGWVANGGDGPELRVEPEWCAKGPPRIDGLRIVVAEHELRYDTQIFRETARSFTREIRAAGRLEADAKVRWSVRAFHRSGSPRSRARIRRAPLPLSPAELPGLGAGMLDVRIHEAALLGLRTHVDAHPGEEVAGLLTGRLLHDAERGAGRLEVSDYHPVPAGAAGTSRTHFALDASSFAAARRALSELAAGELCCGWAHDHPPCSACHDRTDCDTHTIFFSTADYQVQSGAFPAPHQIAIVAGKTAELAAGLPAFQVFGWRAGVMTVIEFGLEHGGDERVTTALLPSASRRSTPLERVLAGRDEARNETGAPVRAVAHGHDDSPAGEGRAVADGHDDRPPGDDHASHSLFTLALAASNEDDDTLFEATD